MDPAAGDEGTKTAAAIKRITPIRQVLTPTEASVR
jgi:hypothetical protein